MESDYQSILPVVRKYKEVNTEMQGIMNDIKEYRNRFRSRQEQLKSESEQLEKIILEFMEKYKHPGIRDQDTTIMKQDKKIKASAKTKTSEVEGILNKHKVDITVHQEVLDILSGKKEQPTKAVLRLKIMK
jgi:predicted phage gp36 major capsid-like protein